MSKGGKLREQGETTRWRILAELRRAGPGSTLTQTEIGRRLGLTRACISLQMQRLAAEGKVQRIVPAVKQSGQRHAYVLVQPATELLAPGS